MFKQLLLPTDGSPRSEDAIRQAIGFAKDARPGCTACTHAGISRPDLIVMASHGRQGLRALLLGSETLKVLTHRKILVLVFR